MKNFMGYMPGLKNGETHSRDFTVHMKKYFSQIHPNFPGWLTMLSGKASSSANKTTNRTFEIYLPPVPSKFTGLNTIYEHMLYLQSKTVKVKSRVWEQRLTHLKS